MGYSPFSRHLGKTTFVHPNSAYIYLVEEGDPTDSGISGDFNSGAWRTRSVNKIKVDQTNSVSVSNSQFTLPAGTYRISATVPAGEVDSHVARLFNVTDNAVFYEGCEARAQDSSGIYTKSYIIGDFTITKSTVFEIQHQCQTSRNQIGFGPANSAANPDILTRVELFKTA